MPLEVIFKPRSVQLHDLPPQFSMDITRHCAREFHAMCRASYSAFILRNHRRAKYWVNQAKRHERAIKKLYVAAAKARPIPWVECEQCGMRYYGVGSSPCCGSLAFRVDHKTGQPWTPERRAA